MALVMASDFILLLINSVFNLLKVDPSQFGKQPWKLSKRPYLSLEDLSKAIVHILKNNLINNEIYNLVSGNFTVNEIVNIIKLKK